MQLLLFWESLEAQTHYFGTFDDVDESVGVEMAQVGFKLDEVGTVKCDINHFAFLTLIQSETGEAGASTFELVENEVFDFVDAVCDDENGLVCCKAFDDEVDNLAFDIDEDDGVYR